MCFFKAMHSGYKILDNLLPKQSLCLHLIVTYWRTQEMHLVRMRRMDVRQ